MATKLTPKDFVEALKEWTILDVVEAVKAIEDEFGIKAATASVAVAAGPAAAALIDRHREVDRSERAEGEPVHHGDRHDEREGQEAENRRHQHLPSHHSQANPITRRAGALDVPPQHRLIIRAKDAVTVS